MINLRKHSHTDSKHFESLIANDIVEMKNNYQVQNKKNYQLQRPNCELSEAHDILKEKVHMFMIRVKVYRLSLLQIDG